MRYRHPVAGRHTLAYVHLPGGFPRKEAQCLARGMGRAWLGLQPPSQEWPVSSGGAQVPTPLFSVQPLEGA